MILVVTIKINYFELFDKLIANVKIFSNNNAYKLNININTNNN